ncbi:xanthine dehydrogenase accessory protein XdhC [Enterobacteriaceae bacterium EKM102V]|uniref:xanthine dehydrogenase accessory protein XdhC n=1 Tax=Pantoea TaxID=53335 RepID=UPI00142D6A3C|nr:MULTISPECIES: xanthine dehydrogenase accessory protein XdhC [Pantoea]KAF6663005.1 xanthine dehydrogenase accessory protein XdhC [Enterobacteriaceae bacterium EKM102V]KAF6671472.1 xanthine dehydrogenase accessory protein XdhC [Pantoea sp. EKM103V]
MIYHDWIGVLHQLREKRQSCVLVTVLSEHGSVPRDSGSKMVVTQQESFLTIGGGHLEFQCIAQARAMLQSGAGAPHTEEYSLGARLGQCCGGKTTLLFEPLLQAQPEIYLFGAGHVGQALVNLLSTLPCHINWIDSRPGQFGHVPAGVVTRQPEEPIECVAEAPAGSYFIIMTHHHPLDFALCEAVLKRNDFAYAGVIGSETKNQRFRYRLAGRGVGSEPLARLRCPIGLPDVKGKLPAEIAVAIAGEIISVYQQRIA